MRVQISHTLFVLLPKYLAFMFILIALPVTVSAQNADIGHSVQPSSRVCLTGVLQPIIGVRVPTFPQIRVWVGGKPWFLQVCRIEPLIPAYPAVEELRKVTGLGLRLVTDRAELMRLQQAAKQGRPVEIDGELRVNAQRLRVDTVRTTDIAVAQCPLAPIAG